MNRRTVRNIVLIWLAWSVIIIGFMNFAPLRYAPSRSDDALMWTANETRRDSNDGKPYLLDPFLNTQVAWDSEFYLSIATLGYEDPDIRTIEDDDGGVYSLSYAFFPLYPFAMKVVRLPFTLLPITPIAASTIAGLIISLLGTLAAMIALYDIVRGELGDEGGIRAGFMMLIFPTSFFFAVVYTEGMFVGLAFCSLALMRRRQLVAAAVLAALATGTRAVGGVLIVPLLLAWWQMYRAAPVKRDAWLRLPLLALPLIAYALWRSAYGVPFDSVEETLFGNGVLELHKTVEAWRQILERARTVPETMTIVVMTVSAIILAFVSCALAFRRYPHLALFGLLALLIPLTGGWTGTQSSLRYVLVVPTLWIVLARWGRNIVFDRAWTLFSILLLGMQAFLFSYDFWVA
jgi:hypothetical protein